jgi:polysaccharide export outer membrane protein
MRSTRLLAIAWCVAACGVTAAQSTPPQNPPPSTPPATRAPTFVAAEYHVGPEDILVISVLNAPPELGLKTDHYTVGADGAIILSQVPPVQVRGLTPRGVEAAVAKAFEVNGIFVNAQVSVTVETYHSQKVNVYGEVGKQGEVTLTGDGMTLTLALRGAGGLTAEAGNEVVITRHKQGAGVSGAAGATPEPDEVLTIDLVRDLDAGKDPPLLPGDVVTVKKAPHVYVNGEVVRKGTAVKWVPHLTVTIAIQLAGGFTPKANKGRVKVTRLVNGKPVPSDNLNEKQQLTYELQPEDKVEVGPKWFSASRSFSPRT